MFVLTTAKVELPSDIAGLITVPYDSGKAWATRLAQEMKVAGLKVDLTKLRA